MITHRFLYVNCPHPLVGGGGGEEGRGEKQAIPTTCKSSLNYMNFSFILIPTQRPTK